MVSKGLTEGGKGAGQGVSVPQAVIPGRPKGEPGIHRAAGGVGKWIPGSRQGARPRNDRAYFAFCIFVTVYPDAASSASKVTLSPTFTCLSMAGSLTR
ncbi:hypothetical protein ACVIU7_005398 [Bradyrhizobium liaoningense]